MLPSYCYFYCFTNISNGVDKSAEALTNHCQEHSLTIGKSHQSEYDNIHPTIKKSAIFEFQLARARQRAPMTCSTKLNSKPSAIKFRDKNVRKVSGARFPTTTLLRLLHRQSTREERIMLLYLPLDDFENMVS